MRFAAVLLLLGLLVSPLSVQPASAGEHVLSGRWTVLNASRAAAARDVAVDQATAAMGPLIRLIARRRLRAGTPIHRRVIIAVLGEQIRAQIGPWGLNTAVNGPMVRMPSPYDGEPIRARQRLQGNVLRQWYRQEDGVMEHTFRANGDRLSVAIRVASPRLPGDVRYTVHYRRR